MYITNFDEFYKDQIANCNTIILSRTENAQSEQIEEVMFEINKINKKASIITTPWNNISSQKIIEVAQLTTKVSIDEEVNLIKKPQRILKINMHKDIHHNNNSVNEKFTTWGIETLRIFNKEDLINKLQYIDDTNDLGMILRAKGIVQVENNQWIQFDYVPNEINVENTIPDYTSRLCIIGNNLNEENLKLLFLASNSI